ncbi:redoxin domain-containing protein [Gaoshiqia sp. Z1-71]|uniref:redoxin domain-containing protein n=1 Tax=Gaoshiqia hydrogeniformans TaxID=3290090 RepID=UPI003BF8286B
MKNLGLLFIVLIFLAACQSNSAKYRITGTIAGLDSGIVYLVKAEAGQAVTLDTVKLVNGTFKMEGDAGVTELHYLRLNERDYFAQFFLENAKIKVESYKDSLRATKVTGSPTTDVFNSYLDELNVMNEKMSEYQQQFASAAASGNQQEMDRIRIDVEAASDNMTVFAKNFVRENSNSVVAPFITLTQLVSQLEYNDLKTLVDGFSADLSESVYLKQLNEILSVQSKTAIGVEAPDFTMNDPDGNPVSLTSLRGKYLLVDFWASWCGPCRQENPNIVDAYKKYKDKGFDILGVSLDRDKDAWLKGIADDQLTWHHVSDLKYWQNEVAQLYGVNSIPHSVLLDKDGVIIAKNLRGPALEEKLKELMP